ANMGHRYGQHRGRGTADADGPPDKGALARPPLLKAVYHISRNVPGTRSKAMALKDKYVVRLAATTRRQLEGLVSSGKPSARVLIRARILLRADACDGGPGWGDPAIADALECGTRTVARVRQKYAAGGLDAALHAKKPTGRQYRKLDGSQEAR